MGSLLVSLLNTANALKVFEQSLTVTQNNVTNADTPGYVKQTLSLVALPFDVSVHEPGGVSAGSMVSSRDAFAERSVRDQQSALGYFKQKASDLTPIEAAFDLSSTAGIAPALSDLFKSFSQLSVNPNDSVSRQAVLDQATTVAQSFQNTANGLASQGTGLDQDSRSTIDGINRLAAVIAEVNSQNRVGPSGNVNAGVDAQLNASLEELSQLVNFTALEQTDGSITIYVGGQTPLVVGNQTFPIQGDFSTLQTAILNRQGVDISAQITGGKLSALLNDKNVVLPSYIKDLNTLAQGVADQVNATLNNGLDRNGAAPSTDLFTYDAVFGAAVTLGVNPLTPDQIAAALPGAAGGNGNALNLAALRDAKDLNGYTFAQLYGNLGARVGRDSATAKDAQSTREQLLGQALSLREQTSGVSLDEEAEHLMALQRSYQAISKMLGVLNDLTGTLINIIK
jgi:flagellar hook-associated protein 1 FlgK